METLTHNSQRGLILSNYQKVRQVVHHSIHQVLVYIIYSNMLQILLSITDQDNVVCHCNAQLYLIDKDQYYHQQVLQFHLEPFTTRHLSCGKPVQTALFATNPYQTEHYFKTVFKLF